MFNLLVKGNGWADGRDTMFAERTFEYTDDEISKRYTVGGQIQFNALLRLPALFVEESDNSPDQLAHVGTITRARLSGRTISLEYAYDTTLPPITNKMLESAATELDMDDFEFSRTHWAVKDVDLFRVLLRHQEPKRHRPRVFQIAEIENIEPLLVSAMMPFHPGFDAVYATLQSAAVEAGLRCRRADDIWENPAIIQDVVSLIDRSRVVICDCTGRNPNVFYEAGIAHTLGRDVILITQSAADIPFDLRHLRYIEYLNNGEGREALKARLARRLADVAETGHA
jgi:hypothetical protein